MPAARVRFEFRYDYAAVRLPARPGSMWDYADLLPLDDPANAVTLGEGGTALLEARHRFGCRVVWKVEAQNPTGSQKDRALALAIAKARELGRQRVVIASTGGAGLACAAYAARAALRCLILVPAGTPVERLVPMQALGARVVEIAGTFRDIERLLERLRGTDWYDATTKRASNPYQMEAPKTIAYELLDDLGRAPERVIVPVGGGATLHGIWQGFEDLRRLGRIGETPRMVAVQPARFNTLEVALERGLTTQTELEGIAMDERVDTVARNLKHGVPPDGADALLAIRRSGGTRGLGRGPRGPEMAKTARRRGGNSSASHPRPRRPLRSRPSSSRIALAATSWWPSCSRGPASGRSAFSKPAPCSGFLPMRGRRTSIESSRLA